MERNFSDAEEIPSRDQLFVPELESTLSDLLAQKIHEVDVSLILFCANGRGRAADVAEFFLFSRSQQESHGHIQFIIS